MDTRELLGKQLVITDDLGTLDNHIGYDGRPLVIDWIDEDGYYRCGGYVVSDGEYIIIN